MMCEWVISLKIAQARRRARAARQPEVHGGQPSPCGMPSGPWAGWLSIAQRQAPRAGPTRAAVPHYHLTAARLLVAQTQAT